MAKEFVVARRNPVIGSARQQYLALRTLFDTQRSHSIAFLGKQILQVHIDNMLLRQ